MPIIPINIDDKPWEFKIIPLNIKINNNIVMRYTDKDGFLNRSGYLAHVVVEPKMSSKDWGEIPTSLITKIIRNINHYLESINKKKKDLRILHTQISVYRDEMNDLFSYLDKKEDCYDDLWNRVGEIYDIIDMLEEKEKRLSDELKYINSDKVVFNIEENGYDVQSI